MSHFAIQPKWLLIGLLWFCYVLNHADRQVLYTLFPALQAHYGFSNETLGLTGALFLWIYGLFSPIAGILGDRWSKPAMVAGSLALWSFFTVLSGLAPNGPLLILCRALLGIAESCFMPAAYALMANAHGPETRSKAIALFATSQMVGVAFGGSISGYIAERFHWQAAFYSLGAIGLLYAWPLYGYLSRLPASIRISPLSAAPARFADFARLLRIPTLQVVSTFVAVATFGLFLVYTWLPTFLFDKFKLTLFQAGYEAAIYPQIGSLTGLLVGGLLADAAYKRTKAARYWLIFAAFCGAGPCIFLLGAAPSLLSMRVAAALFGFCAGLVTGNQAAAAFDVVPSAFRATAIGVLNFLGCFVSGFAPYLGGVARDTIGVGQLMAFTAIGYLCTAGLILYATLRLFPRDRAAAQ
jgi:MFS transporter, Spinster family, sphingosine-1-phosphate transporter